MLNNILIFEVDRNTVGNMIAIMLAVLRNICMCHNFPNFPTASPNTGH